LSGIGLGILHRFRDHLDRFAFRVRHQKLGLGLTFGPGDLGLFVTFRHADLEFPVGITCEHFGTFVALSSHFLFHRGANLFGRQDLLQLHAIDLHAPFIGSVVQNVAQFGIDGITGGEGVVQGELTDHVTQRGLGELFDGLGEVADLVNGFVGVGDLEIEQGVDVDGDVVTGDHVLTREVIDRLAQVDPVFHPLHLDGLATVVRLVVAPVDGPGLIEHRHDDMNARLEGGVVLSEAFDDHNFSLAHHDNPLGHDHNHKDGDSDHNP